MATINFITMNDAEHKAKVLTMMRGLHSEDEAASPVDQSRFPLTIDFFLANPSRGRIVLFQEGASVRGYGLLVPYWSNEFGGALVVVDELFVTPEHRNRGIATSFFRFLGEEKPFEAVALALEVSPANTGARRLYQSLGFTSRRNSLLAYRFPEKGRH
jgi:ribosomal protein S18 acetylase RimI-like enzyme